MKISDHVHCLYSASVERRDNTYVIEVPEKEIQLGDTEADETYRVAIASAPSSSETEVENVVTEPTRDRQPPGPPVDEGDQRDVEIEDIGEQGDGITRVERGFIVIVPDTTQGERVTVEITDVRENVAFAQVIDRKSHFE